MPEVHPITWRDVPRNKFVRGLHPAMFSEQKYRKYMEFVPLGGTVKEVFSVEYDEEYAVEWIAAKLCKPLEILGKEKLIELIEVAYGCAE
ncbi:MAG: hypothetical protein QNJ41_23150 [Xenococcaceae cyanobacterium MO_188.B32]|nr:hypothetical protein [Xenococcaceae cyanobacterium MO_188.B32]